MQMTDRERGLLDQVSPGRLVRKGYALMRAFRNVQSRSDWIRPKDSKAWRSEGDWKTARRPDPQQMKGG